MERDKSFLYLHKDEWNRMKNIGTLMRESRKTSEYVQPLIEKSQQWINSWPDSVQGRILKLEKEKEKGKCQAKNLAIIKAYKQQQTEISKKNKCIENAKEMIFDQSCYGRELISALLESKTLEERDAQIGFKKKIKNSAAEDKNFVMGCYLQNAIDMAHQEEQRAARRREKDKEIARINKTIHLTQCENVKRKKENQKQMEIEDLRRLAKLNAKEAIQKANERELLKKDLEQFKDERKQIQDRKALKESQEDRIVEIWRKYEERKNTIFKKIHKMRFEKIQSIENYNLVKKINDDQIKSYEEFINKGIRTLTRRCTLTREGINDNNTFPKMQKWLTGSAMSTASVHYLLVAFRRQQVKEEEDNQKREEQRKKQYLLAQSNKSLDVAKRIHEMNKNICACDRQCIIAKCNNVPRIAYLHREQNITTFAPSNDRLLQNLRIREKTPSPWSGLPGAHAQFARRAGRTLQQCRYKQPARKVIDDYRKSHGLNPQDLPIDNYF